MGTTTGRWDILPFYKYQSENKQTWRNSPAASRIKSLLSLAPGEFLAAAAHVSWLNMVHHSLSSILMKQNCRKSLSSAWNRVSLKQRFSHPTPTSPTDKPPRWPSTQLQKSSAKSTCSST